MFQNMGLKAIDAAEIHKDDWEKSMSDECTTIALSVKSRESKGGTGFSLVRNGELYIHQLQMLSNSASTRNTRN